MKIKEGYVLREIVGQYVVVPIGKEALQFNGIITLNKSGQFLWKLLQTNITQEQLVESLLDKYEVTFESALKDVLEFLTTLRTRNLLE